MTDQQTKMVVVKGSPDHIYDLWANFENFPKFMRDITAVSKTGDKTSHWVMAGPAGKTLEWDATTTLMDKGRRIGWNSTGGDIETSGTVAFTDLGSNQVEVTFSQHYVPPAGMLGEAVAMLIDNPDKRLEELLRDFKAYAEGDIRERQVA